MYNYSIIIPHKNIPDLLRRCLLSIPERDDIQIVVVDDNSNVVFDIASLPRYSVNGFVFIEDKNGLGAGHVRNVGIDAANGKWMLFIDADDFFADNAFEYFDKYLDTQYDIVHFNQEGCYSDDINEYSDRCEMFSTIIREYCKQPDEKNEDKLRYCMHTPYVKMIRSSLVKCNKIRFDECFGSNDVMFSAKVGYAASDVFAVDVITYYVTVRRGSLTKIHSRENYYSRFCVWVRYNRFLDSINKEHLKVDLSVWLIKALLYFGFSEFCKYVNTLKNNNIGPNIKFRNYFVYMSRFLHKIFRKDPYKIHEKCCR